MSIPPEINIVGKNVMVELMYPGVDDNPTHVEVGMCHVRAADSIRISYDMNRDGWKIEQASTFEWDVNATQMNSDWQEVAFVGAWARKREIDHDQEADRA